MRLICAALLAALLFQSVPALADDYGPHPDIRDVTSAATRLLAHRLREAGVDPATTTVSDVVVVKDQAILSWAAGKESGLMGLVRYADRWWDALDADNGPCRWRSSGFPFNARRGHGQLSEGELSDLGMRAGVFAAAMAHNATFQSLTSSFPRAMCDAFVPRGAAAGIGATYAIQSNFVQSAGSFTYTGTGAPPKLAEIAIRVRPPTPGEIIIYPSPPHNSAGGTGVVFLYVDVNSKTPLTFEKGSKLTIWVPYVLDDALPYELELYTSGGTIGPIKGTIFDNVLTFDMPAFTLPPGETQGEVDGYW